jgi:hypothetical protein
MTFFTRGSIFIVRLPVPGPISSTTSVDFSLACTRQGEILSTTRERAIKSQQERYLGDNSFNDLGILEQVLTKALVYARIER